MFADPERAAKASSEVDEILIQPRDPHAGGPNWALAGFRPRVANDALRAARNTIYELQCSYALDAASMAMEKGLGRKSL